jgi:hypothetical protein
MTRPSDEMLMAYADGELDSPFFEQEVRAWLMHDIEARRLVLLFHQTVVLLCQAFARPMWEAPPHSQIAIFSAYAQSDALRHMRWYRSWWRAQFRKVGLAVLVAVGVLGVASSEPDPTYTTALDQIPTASDPASVLGASPAAWRSGTDEPSIADATLVSVGTLLIRMNAPADAARRPLLAGAHKEISAGAADQGHRKQKHDETQ